MKFTTALLTLFFCHVALSQTTLIDEGFSNGIPSTWSVFDEDQLSPDSSVSFINDAWVEFNSSTDTCAISTSYYSVSSGQTALSMDYLVTPKVNLQSFGHILSWQSKSFDANYPESYVVLISTTDSLPGSFTDTIKVVTNDTPNWKTFSTNLFTKGYANQAVYLAFRNASTDAYILGVDNVKLTTDDVAAVEDAFKVNIGVFPNPVSDQLRLEGPANTNYAIINITGKTVFRGSVNSGKIDLSSLPNGIYFVNFKLDGKTITKKIVKI